MLVEHLLENGPPVRLNRVEQWTTIQPPQPREKHGRGFLTLHAR